MNKTTAATVSIIILSCLIGAAPFIVEKTSVTFYEQNYEANVTVVNGSINNTNLGINSDRNLDFGNIPQGANSTKFLNVSTSKKSLMKIESEGNISEFLIYDSQMYFEGVERIPIELKGRTAGNYTGNVSLNFQIPKNQAGQSWLDLKDKASNIWF